jgi:UDP-N-acetylglucosamine 2-epimerase (non-hydrolysing)
MPEEINRVVTDTVSDYFFVTEESARQNLLHEGRDEQRIYLVGNVMIDSLEESRHLWEGSSIHNRFGLQKGEYGIVTLHRPSNVDNPTTLAKLMDALGIVARELPIIFPVHPRTLKQLMTLNGTSQAVWYDGTRVPTNGIWCLEPLGYLDFMALTAGARLVLTDSGGLQEETSTLGIPCLTLRENTERPITATHGTNRVVGTSPSKIVEGAFDVLHSPRPVLPSLPLWDGKAAQRIVAILREHAKS